MLAKQAIKKSRQLNDDLNLSDVMNSTTCLVHDAYLKLNAANLPVLCNRKEFYLLVATTMRHILVDHFRKKNSKKRGL